MIQTGQAKAILAAEDITEELQLPSETPTRNRTEKAFSPEPMLSAEEKTLISAMDDEPVHLDRLAEKTGLDIATLLVLLFELEMKKAVIQMPGQFFRKIR